MAKFIASLGVLLLFGSFGVASAGGDLHHNPLTSSEPLVGKAHARADVEKQATSDSTAVPMGEMSDEEKERRREVCARKYDACHDRCMSTNKSAKKQRFCIEEKCVPNLAECMKEIPN